MTRRKLHFDAALLPTGWTSDVTLTVDGNGNLAAIATGTEARQGEVQHLPGVVIPGIANVHSHAHQRAMAGLAEHAGDGADSFWTWREVMYGFLRRLGPEDLQAVAAQLYVEMLKGGFTAVGEFQYLHHGPDGTPYDNLAEMTLRCLQAAREAGIGFTALPVLYAYGDFGAAAPSPGQARFLNDAPRFLRLAEAIQQELEDDPNTSLGIAPHSLRAVSPALLEEVLNGIANFDAQLPVHLHIAEQQKEVEDCLAWCGQRPVSWLLNYVLADMPLSDRWCAIHATHMTPEETAGLAAAGTIAGLCPTTEANLGDGTFPAPTFLRAGGTIAIGSDSHITVSPAQDLRMLEYGQRLRDRARNVLADGPRQSTGRSLLDRVLQGGAQALQRPIGALVAGQRADLVVLDPDHPALIGRCDDALLDSWIFSGGNACIAHVFVGGHQVVESGRHIREQEILQRFRSTLSHLR